MSTDLSSPPFADDAEAIQFVEAMTRNANSVQTAVLAEILSRNAGTEYLQRFELGDATDRETFKSNVPVVSYDHLQPDIDRIANGDRSAILTADAVSEFFLSTGTSSGKTKIFPMTEEAWNRGQVFFWLGVPIVRSKVEGLDKGKGLYFYFVNEEKKTPGGFLTRVATTKILKSHKFRTQSSDPSARFTDLNESMLCLDRFQSMYAQMLCGLYDHNQINRVGAVFAYILIRVIRFLQLNWQQLIHDIRTGTLNPNLTDPGIKELLNRILKPDLDLADFLTREFSKENWGGIIPRIWPNAKYVEAIFTGSMLHYAPMLHYYSGDLPLISTAYSSSECSFGLNLNPICNPSEVSYTIMPNMGFFEFELQEPTKSESTHDSPHRLVDLVDVEIGKEYEIVVTTYAGLYRYRVGDILRVTGFHNSSPEFQFVRRKNALLSINLEATGESELQRAVKNASHLLSEINVTLMDYTSRADTEEIPGHYVIYWELSGSESPSNELMGRCCLAMEELLNSFYRSFRAAKIIGALEIRIVKNGTFEEFMEHAISAGASLLQYKVPRCVNSKAMIQLLDSRVISSHFSPSLPHQTLTME